MDQCVICNSSTRLAFTAQVMGKYEAQYRYCEACGHLRVQEPHWIDEAYTAAISAADTGIVWRNQKLKERVCAVIVRYFDVHGSYLDAAGGTGLFVRMMRDAGLDFFWEDKYCENLFARRFEDRPGSNNYAGVTAFEVFEHVPDPLAYVQGLLQRTDQDLVLFTTELFNGGPPPQDWWYYAFATGQHISFYQPRTLSYIAQHFNLHFSSAKGFHVFSAKPINEKSLKRTLRNAPRLNRRVEKMLPSLRDSDHERVMQLLEVASPTSV